MASSATQSSERGDNVSLKVMVDKVRNKVVYAEAGKDFVDVLFSFLTLPMGTIARLVATESTIEAVKFGSISSLYQSVSDLDQQYLCSHTCKEMLLKPRNSMEGYCNQLKLEIDDTPMQYFWCKNWNLCCISSNVSTFRNQKCKCGSNTMAVHYSNLISVENGFVNETATFIIQDDLSVLPNDLGKSLCLLQNNGIDDIADIERKTLLISKKEVIDLLKLSLLSKTPLTDFIVRKKQLIRNSNTSFMSENRLFGRSLPSEDGKKMAVKLLVRKSNRKILFAIAEEDFADFLFSFLTFPLGGVLQMLGGSSSLSCIDSLYKCVTELSPEKCLRSLELKNKISKPQIFPGFEVKNQILPIGTSLITYKSSTRRLNFVDPKSSVSGGFTRGPLTVMVTEDLVVTQMSSFDCVSYLERMKVPLNDVEEMVINIGLKEGLSILKASLTSTTALTNGLKHYLVFPFQSHQESSLCIVSQRNVINYRFLPKAVKKESFSHRLNKRAYEYQGIVSVSLLNCDNSVVFFCCYSVTMAANASDKRDHNDQVPLTFFVDKERNKVLYAEAGKDFVDALFSFLTLPLGTIARLVAKDSNIEAVRFGSISSLYQSVSDLDEEEHLCNQTCKEMLLKPRSSMESSYRDMKLKIDDTEQIKCFVCDDNETCIKKNGRYLSFFTNQKCICGKLMNKERLSDDFLINGFVEKAVTFIVGNDLHVMPYDVGAYLNLLRNLGVNNTDAIDEQIVIDLLKLSLVSKTPLSDFIFKREQFVNNLDPRNRLEFWIANVEEQYDESKEMLVKVVRRKSNEQILFVEGYEDFADFVLSFLTFPLGGVLRMFKGLSFLSSIDNLYDSVFELNQDRHLNLPVMKDSLTNPVIASQFELKNQILPIASLPINGFFKYFDPKSPISGGYSRGPISYMVKDDLVVTPISSMKVISYLEKMKVPLNDVEDRFISIGVKEVRQFMKLSAFHLNITCISYSHCLIEYMICMQGLSLLKASLTTTSALTNGLSLYIIEQFMHEQRSQSTHKY
ncbi:unnamed protein product [Trifolium pratense]|uniref:Uncharacterized protein n=1 Tax=Trifolium pratense TaxID=57577 RepID=A0ACB0LQM1_TRIPR|nr:unnamed protein product [Trifolium pratense]